ncbi:Glyoxylate reductase [Larimichthys crocea]|uniref:Uncharacterized protein n=1 Tax=Larimichthys crocea TaxID=215358 RepID=A0ACD3RFZ7_LARCR|nr:Glyoxylate reductase [Larimichthys crocea]
MEDNKPWALISEVGEQGYIEEVTDIMKKHFQIICHKDFLQNPQLHGPKIQAMFVWNAFPEAEPALLGSLPSLKVVANGGVGIDHLDVPYINSLGVKVTNTPDVVTDATADMALGLLLASARKIVEGHQIAVNPKTTHIPQSLMGVEVAGSTMGIIGMGRIGCKIAQRGKGFDMKILYHNRNRRSVEDEQALGASYCENMDDLLKESDFVVLAVNLTPETTGLISHRELSLMKRTATLVNVSRGLVVDQDALVKALHSGTIHAAALDVTHPEPLPRSHHTLQPDSQSVFIKQCYGHRELSMCSFTKAMEDDKPWALISEVGEQGYLEEIIGIITECFQIICYKDFIQNPQLHGPKIQVLFVWYYPKPEPWLLSLLPSLKVVASGGVGIDHLDVPYINSLGVKVTNTPDVVTDATADMALGLLLASARKIVEGHQIAVNPKTTYIPQSLMGVEVAGSTMGIIGMGRIGCKIAQRGKGFDMKILYHNRNRRSVEDEQALGASYCENMDDLLKESDFVMLAVNLTPETTGLISHRELSLMKRTATLVNVSRGLVVDQDVLVKALHSGTIHAAALDVTHPEPLPRSHTLYNQTHNQFLSNNVMDIENYQCAALQRLLVSFNSCFGVLASDYNCAVAGKTHCRRVASCWITNFLQQLTDLLLSKRQMAMEDNKPWALISEVGEQDYFKEVTHITKQHFQIICYKDFIQNPQLHGPKIQAMFVWYYPKPEPWLLSLLPSLKVVANGGVGIDHLDVPYINSLGVKVTNTPDVVTDATADMALGLLLASARKIVEGHHIAVNSKTTYIPQSLMGVEVAGSTMGIIGMGRIGCKIAQRGKGFDMKILYHNRNRR